MPFINILTTYSSSSTLVPMSDITSLCSSYTILSPKVISKDLNYTIDWEQVSGSPVTSSTSDFTNKIKVSYVVRDNKRFKITLNKGTYSEESTFVDVKSTPEDTITYLEGRHLSNYYEDDFFDITNNDLNYTLDLGYRIGNPTLIIHPRLDPRLPSKVDIYESSGSVDSFVLIAQFLNVKAKTITYVEVKPTHFYRIVHSGYTQLNRARTTVSNIFSSSSTKLIINESLHRRVTSTYERVGIFKKSALITLFLTEDNDKVIYHYAFHSTLDEDIVTRSIDYELGQDNLLITSSNSGVMTELVTRRPTRGTIGG